MARPVKTRRICAMPVTDCFGPAREAEGEPINMTLEEYETIRLIDLQGYTQEECAGQMEVARTTVQSVYNSARMKLADALVNGRQLKICGGNYELCPKSHECCGRTCRDGRCSRRSCDKKYNHTGGCFYEDCSNI